MKKNNYAGKPGLDLVEETVHTLRQTPLRSLFTYYAGTAPFVLSLLYFWTDMSCGADARGRCASSAFGLALLFVWMKCWQTVFASQVRERISPQTSSKWTLARTLRMAATQAALQPSKILLVPAAFILTLPFGWIFAFYENATVLGDGNRAGMANTFQRSGRQARLWTGQNHLIIAILFLFGLVIWLNTAIALAIAPALLKMFLGIETAFTRGGYWSVFNSTFLATSLALAYLAMDPLVKVLYVLRCFYGEALRDGADLSAELASLQTSRNLQEPGELARIQAFPRSKARSPFGAAKSLILVALFIFASPLEGAEPSKPVARTERLSAGELDQALRDTLLQTKYRWRFPREEAPENGAKSTSWLRAFLAGAGDTIKTWAQAFWDSGARIYKWLKRKLGPAGAPARENTGSGGNWVSVLQGFAFVLLALAASALAILIWRVWSKRRRGPEFILATALNAQPDLRDENVTASQLPEEAWLHLAAELIERGESRLALRALYLAALAHLARRELITPARFKSNREYVIEVLRRAKSSPDLGSIFVRNVLIFERAWYGLHEVTGDLLQEFRANLERMRIC